MEKKVIKLLVATDNKDTKILLDLGNGNRDEIIKKIEDVLKEEYSIDSKIIEKKDYISYKK